jgi:hypothetical protein
MTQFLIDVLFWAALWAGAYWWHLGQRSRAYGEGCMRGVEIANTTTLRLQRAIRERLADRNPGSYDDYIEALVAATDEIVKEVDAKYPPPH